MNRGKEMAKYENSLFEEVCDAAKFMLHMTIKTQWGTGIGSHPSKNDHIVV